MSEYPRDQEPFTNEAEPVPSRLTDNGHRRKSKNGSVPGLNLSELIEERNYSALAGLALLALGGLLVVQDVLGLSFSLWSLVLIGIGGWIMADAWKSYESQQRTWTDVTRNRMFAGALIIMVAVMGMVSINWWSFMLLVAGGWLAYDTWQRYEANGQVMDQTLRNRALAAALIGGIGFFGFFHLGSAWPLILIVVGGVMLYRHLNENH